VSLDSRFIRQTDPATDRLVLPLPGTWWSRPYEYEWARQFAQPGDVARDAACGIGHPFKFHLADVCREVHACDLDPRILSEADIRRDVAETMGAEEAARLPSRYFSAIHFARASITALPYPEQMFDKVYCVSVLEHLAPADLNGALAEFRRVLKDDGLLVLTMDYPSVDPAGLATTLRRHGLALAGPVSFDLPADAIYSDQWHLNCFRVVARKRPLIRVLIGAPIRQGADVLQPYLESLAGLDRSGLAVEYCFVDDNEQASASALLRRFAEAHPTTIVPGSGAGVAYQRDQHTHRWSEELVWKVAAYKDQIIERALAGGYDYLFFVDSDLLLHPFTLQQLMGSGKEIVSEIFWTRWTPEQPELPQVWEFDHYTLYAVNRAEQQTNETARAGVTAFLERLRRPGVYRVGGLGACTLLARRPLEAGARFAEIYNISFWGEDRHFCIRAAALGFTLWVDTHLPAYHIYRQPDLAGVGAYVSGYLRAGEQLALVNAVREGLQRWGTTDWRTITGLEGLAFFAPDLQAKMRADQVQARAVAQHNQVAGESRVTGLTVTRLDLHQGVAQVVADVINQGVERGQTFADQLVARVSAQRIDGRWVIAGVEFAAPERTVAPPAPAPAPTAPPAPAIFAPKPTGNKLTLSMVVRNEAGRYLRSVLSHAASYVDEFVIIDDASDDDTVALCRDAVGKVPLTLIQNPEPRFSNEIVLRRQQWEATLATRPDWMLLLDADELFEDRIRSEIRPLINQTQFDVVSFRLYDMWDPTHYREDQFWQAHKIFRPFLLRFRPDFAYRWKETAQHCGRMPVNVLDLPGARSPVRLKHLGWSNPADRLAKYERYMKLDPEGKFGILGQYKSIMDEHPILVPWGYPAV